MFKKLKSIFIVEGEGGGDKSPNKESIKEETKEPEIVDTPSAFETSSTSVPAQAGEGKITEKFMNILLGALEKNNIEGFDYLEFKQSLQSLEKMQMDDATRYKSAFAMAQTMGTNAKKLIDTAQHYVNVLKKEEHKFQQALSNQKSKQIGDKELRTKKLAETINLKNKQIEQLTKEIAAHHKEMENIQQEISSSSVKVMTTKNNFNATYQLLISQIMVDVENMKQYLK